MDLTFLEGLGVLVLVLFLIIKVGIRERRQILKEDFKKAVKDEFKRDYEHAWLKYVPTETDVVTYQQFLQNQIAQTNMSQMMTNMGFAAGQNSLLGDVGRINSLVVSNKMQKRASVLYALVYYGQLILQAINSPTSDTEQVVELSAEFAYQNALAIKLGALPYNVHMMNSIGSASVPTIHN